MKGGGCFLQGFTEFVVQGHGLSQFERCLTTGQMMRLDVGSHILHSPVRKVSQLGTNCRHRSFVPRV